VGKRDLRAAIALLALALLLWAPVLARPGNIAFGLDLSQFLYWEHYARAELAGGNLPLWNPYVFSGAPFLANPQTRLFYPPAIALRLLPIEVSFGWGQALHFWWAGLAMYALMRDWGSRPWGAMFGAIALMMGGFLVPRLYAGHADIIQGVCWTPLALLLFSRALRTGRLVPLLAAGAALAVQFLSGFVPIVFYSGLLLLAYVAWWLVCEARAGDWRPLASGVLRAGTLAAAFAALAAVQLLPTLELARWSTRAGGLDIESANLGSFAWRHLVTLIVPHYFYDPVNHLPFPDELAWETCAYVGLLPLLLAPLALKAHRRRARFWAAVAGCGMILAFGTNLPFFPLLWRIIPFFRVPGQFLLLWCLGVAALAGLAVGALAENPELMRRQLNLAGAGLASLAGVSAILWVVGAPALLAPEAGAQALVGYNLRTAAVRAAACGVAAFAAARSKGHVGAGALTAALAMDLWLFGRYYVIPVRMESLLQANAEVFEVIRSGPGDSRWAPVELDLTVGTAVLLGNQSMVARAPSTSGYAPLFLEHYAELVALSSAQDISPDAPFVDFPQFGLARPWVLDLLGVRYMVTTAELPVGTLLLDGAVRVYENPAAMPLAFWVGGAVGCAENSSAVECLGGTGFDPASVVVLSGADGRESRCPGEEGRVGIVNYEPRRVELDVEAPADGWVVIADTYYPGWQARVDGQPAPIVRADWALRAVSVPAGETRVVLEYRSVPFEIGARVSSLTLAALVVLASIDVARSRRRVVAAKGAAARV